MTTLVKLRDTAAVHCFWKGNITFQSRFMSTTVQWLVAARSSATSRRPNPVLAHRVISLRCRILSLSGHSGHRSSRTNQARFMSTRPSLSLYDESQTTVKCVSLSADHTKQQLTSALGSEKLDSGGIKQRSFRQTPGLLGSAPIRHVAGRSFLRAATILIGVPIALGAPGDGPPCIRHLPLAIAGDWHGLPLRRH
jgi:hypothetical protein